MIVQKRNLISIAILLIITLGLYFIYWTVKTKGELNTLSRGETIPTAFLIVIPILNFYFWYKYAQVFVADIKKGTDPVGYFLLLSLLPFIGIFIVQAELNKFAERAA